MVNKYVGVRIPVLGYLFNCYPSTTHTLATENGLIKSGRPVYCRVLEESSSNRITFSSLYLLKYFGMVTMEQKEGKRVENVLSDSQLNYLKSLS